MPHSGANVYPNDYIHYWANDADFSNIYELIAATKQEMLINYGLSALAHRQARKRDELSHVGMSADVIEDLFSGDMFTNLSNASPGEANVDGGRLLDIESALVQLSKVPQEISKASDFTEKFDTGIGSYLATKDASHTVQDYAALILQMFAQNQGAYSGVGPLATKIIASLLGRNDEEFFRATGKALNLETDTVKIIAMVASLPYADLSGSMAINHSHNSRTNRVAQGESDIAGELFSKYNSWVTWINTHAAETGFSIGTLKGNKEVLERLQKANIKIDTSLSGESFDVKTTFQPDSEIQKMLDLIDTGFNKKDVKNNSATSNVLAKKTSKSDVAFSYSDGKVSASIGVNVKDYTDRIDINKAYYDFKIQDSTPLMTLLIREAGLKGNQMTQLFNLAAVHGRGRGSNVGLEGQWNSLMDSVKYKALLNTIAGFTPPEEAYYISINGNLWTMSDFLYHILSSNSTVQWQPEKNPAGLLRSTYVGMNHWLTSNHTGGKRFVVNPKKAGKRSDQAKASISNQMYATKIRVEVRLSELVALFRHAL